MHWFRPAGQFAALLAVSLLALCVMPVTGGGQTSGPQAKTALKAPSGTQYPLQPGYAGSDACINCHEKSYKQFQQTTMGKIFLKNPRNAHEAMGCEACHGPAIEHVNAGGGKGVGVLSFGKDSKSTVEEQNARCLPCHERGARRFWRASTHESRGLACVSCHQLMHGNSASVRFQGRLGETRNLVKPTEVEVCFQCHPMRRAQLRHSSHMPFREGKVTCTSCHNPHGSPNPKLLIEATVNQNCYKCHAERRGPFLWEHPPVMEDCLNCHDPHGSSNPQLLKARAPRLCQRCHDMSDASPGHQGIPFPATGKGSHFAFNRSCTNCHSQIHGSNHPSGVRFQR